MFNSDLGHTQYGEGQETGPYQELAKASCSPGAVALPAWGEDGCHHTTLHRVHVPDMPYLHWQPDPHQRLGTQHRSQGEGKKGSPQWVGRCESKLQTSSTCSTAS